MIGKSKKTFSFSLAKELCEVLQQSDLTNVKRKRAPIIRGIASQNAPQDNAHSTSLHNRFKKAMRRQ